jgi:hypothetical protein
MLMHKVVTRSHCHWQDVLLWEEYGEMEQGQNNLDLQYTLNSCRGFVEFFFYLRLPIRILVIATVRRKIWRLHSLVFIRAIQTILLGMHQLRMERIWLHLWCHGGCFKYIIQWTVRVPRREERTAIAISSVGPIPVPVWIYPCFQNPRLLLVVVQCRLNSFHPLYLYTIWENELGDAKPGLDVNALNK